MAKNKQFNKNVKKQDRKSMHSVMPKCDSDSQIMIEETMEMRLDRCVQKVKDLSELVIGYTPYKLNFVINSYSGITNKPSKVSAFANAVVGIILADGQSSFTHIGSILGLNVDVDLAERKMLENAINQMLNIHLLEGDESAYNVTELGRTFAEHGEKMEPYPSKFSLWYVPEYINYLNLHSDISESFVRERPEEEIVEIPSLTTDEIKCLAEKQASHAHSSKDRYILQEVNLEKTEHRSYDLWACFIRSVRTKQVRVLIYDDNTQKILTELSCIIDNSNALKKNLYDSMLGNNPDVVVIEQKDAIATEEQIKAEEDLLNEEEQNGSEQPKEKTSSIEERLHKRALYDSISFESELHTIFQHDNADEIWLSSPWVGDEAFMQSRLPLIQAFILQGGKVFISYSEAEEGLDRSNGKGKMVGWQSNKAINNLAKTYPGQFFYAQFTAFHSKNVIEVKNGQSILFTGSFNVLSFHVTSEHESHIRKEEMALAHYQVAENKYRDFKRQFAEVYIKRAEDSLDFLNENAILNYQNPALDYFRKDDALAPLFTDFDDKLDELKFSIRNKKFVRKTKVRSNVTPNIQEETKEEQTRAVVSSQNHTPIDSKEDKLQKTLDMAKVHIDADLIDENTIFLKLVSLCYVSIGDNSTKVELQVPWDVELVGFLSRSDVQKLTKINVIKGREEGTTNIYVLMNNIVFRFFNLTLSRSDFFALFTRKETLQPGLQMAQPKDMSKIILEG